MPKSHRAGAGGVSILKLIYFAKDKKVKKELI